MALSRWSNMSDCPSSVLKSAEPASTRPATFGRSLVMKYCVVCSATCRAVSWVGHHGCRGSCRVKPHSCSPAQVFNSNHDPSGEAWA